MSCLLLLLILFQEYLGKGEGVLSRKVVGNAGKVMCPV